MQKCKNAKMQKCKKLGITLTILTATGIANTSWASQSVTIKNDVHYKLYVIFRALGCAGLSHSVDAVCDTKVAGNEESVEYTFKDGTSLRSVGVCLKHPQTGDCIKPVIMRDITDTDGENPTCDTSSNVDDPDQILVGRCKPKTHH